MARQNNNIGLTLAGVQFRNRVDYTRQAVTPYGLRRMAVKNGEPGRSSVFFLVILSRRRRICIKSMIAPYENGANGAEAYDAVMDSPQILHYASLRSG